MTDKPLPPTVALVLHFRHCLHTAACLESLLGDGIAQVMLVDNSEDDGSSLDGLRSRLDALERRGMKVALYEPGRNLGFSAGVNAGLEQIVLRFGSACVLLINNDARLVSGSHAPLRETIARGADLAVAEIKTRSNGTIRSIFYHRQTGLLLRMHVTGAYPFWSGCCAMLAPKLATSRLFDEDFFFYGDDIELGWRLKKEQGTAVTVAGAAVEHDVSVSSRNGSLFYEYHMARAHWLLARKLAGNRGERGMFLLGRVVFLPVRALMRVARQRSLVPLKGLALATADVIRGRCRALTPPPEPASAVDGLATPAAPRPPSPPR